MLLDYYNLKEQPFGVTPDPRYLYMSPTHREALASLCYGIRSARGFTSIIAEPGMGKTTILFKILNELQSSARTVFLFQTFCRPEDLLRGILRELGVVDESGDLLRMQSQLDDILLAEAQQGRKVVVVIDEAQHLEDSALEFVRMLSNCETSSEKLLQIVLGGQSQLSEKLASPRLLQLRQRMSIFARLCPLNLQETRAYIEHRLRVAGYNSQVPLFTPQAEALVAKHSQGIPRNINNICFNALSLGWVLKQRTIEKSAVREVLDDLDIKTEDNSGRREVSGWGGMNWNAVEPRTSRRQVLAWRSRVAPFALLLPLLLGMSNRTGDSRTVARPSLPAASAAILKDPAPPIVEVSGISRSVADATLKRQSQTGAQSTLNATDEGSQSRRSSERRRTSAPSRTTLVQTADPVTLWNQVKIGRSDAEVELARIYLEGTRVERNCTQAQVLLQDASRKGNARAADLLTNPSAQCQ